VRYRFVAAEKAQHAVSLLCRVVGVTRAGFYAWARRGRCPRRVEDEWLCRLIQAAWDASRQTYGAPRIHAELAQRHGVRVGRKRVARLMRRLGISGVTRRRRTGTTRPDLAAPPAPDLVARRFAADGRDRLWVADITQVATGEGWLYLGVVMDMWSRRIVGWSMCDRLDARLVVDAVAMAVARRRPGTGVIHHSDRGSQYTSITLADRLEQARIVASMGRTGSALDNAACESVISQIKCELVHRHRFHTRNEARMALFHYIEGFYNPRRRHSSLGFKSPIEYEKNTNHHAAPVAA